MIPKRTYHAGPCSPGGGIVIACLIGARQLLDQNHVPVVVTFFVFDSEVQFRVVGTAKVVYESHSKSFSQPFVSLDSCFSGTCVGGITIGFFNVDDNSIAESR